ncbi:16S rRNA (adenine(1518)-N(6)/adenine(1519)-N(6))-dimethyltransferase RsmA [bacterium]|nr:16S rRNA (adenine(1518)-N(6)/adenine(1519)-N(6))-dimethyltransferase RsmA [bacterium]
MQQHGLWAKKSFGQHFLLDGQLLAKIVRAAGGLEEKTVVEIGPGPGGLTRAILDAGPKRFIAVEKDRDLEPLLREIAEQSHGLMELRMGDATRVNWQEFGERITVISNLPYNVSTLILTGLIEAGAAIENMVLMFQKEVAERLYAAPDSKDYGRLSVLCQHRCHVTRAFDVPPGAFVPPPKVMSSVVVVTPKMPVPSLPLEWLERVTGSAFGQRRKMLRSSLKSLNVPVEELLADAGIDGTRRAETLSVPEFELLARAYGKLGQASA